MIKRGKIILAMDEKNLNVQTITKLINRYEGISTTTSEVRAFIRDPKGHLEPYIRLILDIEPDRSFKPVLKPYDAKKDYEKRIQAMDNQEVYTKNNAAAVQAFIRVLGGHCVVEVLCGLKPMGARHWLQFVNDEGIRGYIPEQYKSILKDYAKRIKCKLTPEFKALLEPSELKPTNFKKRKPSFSKYTGVTKVGSGRFKACISVSNRNVYIGTYDIEADAALAYNEFAKKLERPLNEVSRNG